MSFYQSLPNGGQSDLSQLVISDVNARSDVADECAVEVKSWYAVIEKPAVFSVVSPHPILRLERFAQVERCPGDMQAPFEVLRMHYLPPAFAKLRVCGATTEFEPRL